MLKSLIRLLVLAMFALSVPVTAKPADNGDPVKYNLRIERQPLSAALQEFATQTGLQIIFFAKVTDGHEAPPLNGKFTAADAIAHLLDHSNLTYEQLNPNTIQIRPQLATNELSRAGENAEGSSVNAVQESAATTTAPPDPAAGPPVSPTSASASHDNDTRSVEEVLISSRKAYTDENVDIVRSIDDVQPYYILKSQTLEQSGDVNVEDFLKDRLTMNTVTQSNSQQASGNYFGNTSSINLRGLGTNQTLVLINGRRAAGVSAFGSTGQPDVNAIPIAAIDRIEVLPSSSAAIYGGAAIGGVVNIVLKHNYEGGEAKITYNSPTDTNAPIRSVDASYGLSLEDGKTHLMVAAHYSDEVSPLIGDRLNIWQRGVEQAYANSPSYVASSVAPFNSGSTPNIGSADGSDLTLKPAYGGGSLNSPLTYIPIGTSASTPAAVLGAGLLANAGKQNLAFPNNHFLQTGLLNQIENAPTVKSILLTARRQMTDALEVFAEFSDYSNIGRNPEANYGSPYEIPASAATNPFNQDVYVMFPDGQTSLETAKNLSRRATFGATLKLPHDWQGEADYTWNFNQFTNVNPFSDYSALPAALAAGQLNPFVDTQTHPLDLASYNGATVAGFPSSLSDVGLHVSGPVAQLPAGAPTLTVGLEHRREALESGYLYGEYPSYPADGFYENYLNQSQTTDSAYLEGAIPLVSADMRLPWVHELALQAAVRTERYSVTAGTTEEQVGDPTPLQKTVIHYTSTNPTIGFKLEPVRDLMLRVSYGTAFLPPSYSQLLAPQLGGTNGTSSLVPIIDPLRGNELRYVQYISGGNPDLKPQRSKDWDIGLVYEPTPVPGLRLDIEYYRLTMTNVAITPTAQQIVSQESMFPGRVTRTAPAAGDPYGVGAVTVVDDSLIAANKAETDGYDFSAHYRKKTSSFGVWELSLGATVIEHFRQQEGLIGSMQELVGQVAAGGPLEARGNATLNWDYRDWTLGWTTRYFGSYSQYSLGGATAYVEAQGNTRIPSQTYHDFFVSYRVPTPGAGNAGGPWYNEALSGITIQGGIKNVFNKLPPFDAYYQYSGYYSPFGDARLRSYWVSLIKDF